MTKPFLLGVLGGMGPLATTDFQRRLLDATPAQNDRQQIPSVVWNVPQIADRQRRWREAGRRHCRSLSMVLKNSIRPGPAISPSLVIRRITGMTPSVR